MNAANDKPDVKKCRSDALTAEELASFTVIELTPSETATAERAATNWMRNRNRRSGR